MWPDLQVDRVTVAGVPYEIMDDGSLIVSRPPREGDEDE